MIILYEKSLNNKITLYLIPKIIIHWKKKTKQK